MPVVLSSFQVRIQDVGDIKKLFIRHDNTGLGAGWYLEKVSQHILDFPPSLLVVLPCVIFYRVSDYHLSLLVVLL